LVFGTKNSKNNTVTVIGVLSSVAAIEKAAVSKRVGELS
jgi:hypothetical protein